VPARLFLVLVACLAAACAGVPGTGVGDREQRVQQAIGKVADAQRAAEPVLREAVDALRSVPRLTDRLRDPEQVDAALSGRAPSVLRSVAVVDPDRIAARVTALDHAVAAARTAAVGLGEGADADGYLAAQRELVDSLGVYADAVEDLGAVLTEDWDTVERWHELTTAFTAQRGNFRSAEEAAQAYEVEQAEVSRPLRALTAAVRDAVAAREAAGRTVNEAVAALASLEEQSG
jgi:hypothetical protein